MKKSNSKQQPRELPSTPKNLVLIGSIHSDMAEAGVRTRHGISTANSVISSTRAPRAVKYAKSIANYLLGRTCIYKDKGYIGPVSIDFASSSYRWIQISFITHPWGNQETPQRRTLIAPIRGISAEGFSIHVSAGYGINGIFVHDASAIEAINQLYVAGADGQEIIHAINFGKYLPENISMLRYMPLKTSA